MSDVIESGPVENTDCEIWTEREGDYYVNAIFVTKGGSIGFNVGGNVIVMPAKEWHALAVLSKPSGAMADAVAALRDLAKRLNNKLYDPEWRPSRSHVESCRNEVLHAIAKIEAPAFQQRGTT